MIIPINILYRLLKYYYENKNEKKYKESLTHTNSVLQKNLE